MAAVTTTSSHDYRRRDQKETGQMSVRVLASVIAFLGAGSALVILASIAGIALADDQLDQHSEVYGGHHLLTWYPNAQSFKAGVSGVITHVQIPVIRSQSMADNRRSLLAEIRPVVPTQGAPFPTPDLPKPGLPDTSRLGYGLLTWDKLPVSDNPYWLDIPFRQQNGQPAAVTAGTAYALVIRTDPPGSSALDLAVLWEYGVSTASTGPYPDGIIYYWPGWAVGSSNPFDGLGSWLFDSLDDAAFRTYVETGVADTAPPTASPTQLPAANSAGWNTTNVTITWNWADGVGGSGIDSVNCTTSSTSSGQGLLNLAATCKDLEGNVGTVSYAVKVDMAAPAISAAATTQPNTEGWYNTPVTVHFSCSDALSGVTTCPADQILSTEGSAVSSTAWSATDLAGNTSAASNVVTSKLDRTPPVVTVTGVSSGDIYPGYRTGCRMLDDRRAVGARQSS
jgi:hypothetical protein